MNSRPNILLITTDQQRVDSLSCYGSTFTHTPNLDRLAAGGALCQRAYCVNPVCTPSRTTIFTGQYVSRHGAWNVGMSAPQDTTMISHRLAAQGYRTHYIGKAHFQAFGGDPDCSMETRENWQERYANWYGPYYGFESVELALGHTTYGLAGHYGHWVRSQVSEAEFETYQSATRLSKTYFGGEAFDWDLPLYLHNSVWSADRTIDFLKRTKHEKPFLLSVGFQDPHHPHCVPTEFTERVNPADVPLPRYSKGELADKPPHFGVAHTGNLEESDFRGAYPVAGQGRGADYTQVSEEDARMGRAYYYTMVKLIDQQVGRILDCLDEQGLAENTLVIFLSDHGELLGDHGLWMKGPFHYEELVRIPMIVRWPAQIPAGQEIHGLINQADIVPTILTALEPDSQPEIPAEIDGVNTLPMLRGDTEIVRASTIVECIDDPQTLRLKTLITENHKLTVYYGPQDYGQNYGELYDLAQEPGEIVNQWSQPAYAAIQQQLMGQLWNHMERLERRVPRVSYA